MFSCAQWRTYHSELEALINGDFPSRRRRLLTEVIPERVFLAASNDFSRRNKEALSKLTDSSERQYISVTIDSCQSTAPSILGMKNWLNEHLSEDIHSAVIHGSLGTNEEVNYSDFDALVIIKNEVLIDANRLAQTAFRLYQARRFMYEQDPLQHHGWFVLPEQAITSWPEDYFPVEVLRNSTLLNPVYSLEYSINPIIDKMRCQKTLFILLDSIEQEVTTGSCFMNIYKFKSMISKVLLLPTLYVQIRDGKGVFKRDSFSLAIDDFSTSLWIPIMRAEAVRMAWPKIRSFHPFWMSQRPGWLGGICRRISYQHVPRNFKEYFNEEVVSSLLELSAAIKQSEFINK